MSGVGFTGTQTGMTRLQAEAVRARLLKLRERHDEFHHGDCVGADAEAASFADLIDFVLHSHPPKSDRLRAFVASHVVYPARTYLRRDQDIVDACDVLLAAPSAMTEELRSGTWATVRRGRKARRPIIIVYPDGSVVEESA